MTSAVRVGVTRLGIVRIVRRVAVSGGGVTSFRPRVRDSLVSRWSWEILYLPIVHVESKSRHVDRAAHAPPGERKISVSVSGWGWLGTGQISPIRTGTDQFFGSYWVFGVDLVVGFDVKQRASRGGSACWGSEMGQVERRTKLLSHQPITTALTADAA